MDLGGVLVSITEAKSTGGLETVALAHSSIREYILNPSNCAADNGFPDIIQSTSQVHATLSHACLTYLCYEDHSYGPSTAANPMTTPLCTELFAQDSQMTEDFDRWVRSMHLQQYASFEWATHHVAAGDHAELVSHALRRFIGSEKSTIRWLQVCQMELPLQLLNSLRSVLRPDYNPNRLLESLKQVNSQIGVHLAEFTTWMEHFTVKLRAIDISQTTQDQPGDKQATRWSRAMTLSSAIRQTRGWGVYACLPAAHTAAFFDFHNYLAEYLSNGGDPNVRAYLGASPLHLASQGNARRCAKLLCGHIDTVIELEDVAGFTPQDYAIREIGYASEDLFKVAEMHNGLEHGKIDHENWYSGWK